MQTNETENGNSPGEPAKRNSRRTFLQFMKKYLIEGKIIDVKYGYITQ